MEAASCRSKKTSLADSADDATDDDDDDAPPPLGYLSARDAAALDAELMSHPGFSLEQLMELAGLSVAEAVYDVVFGDDGAATTAEAEDGGGGGKKKKRRRKKKKKHVLLVCG